MLRIIDMQYVRIACTVGRMGRLAGDREQNQRADSECRGVDCKFYFIFSPFYNTVQTQGQPSPPSFFF